MPRWKQGMEKVSDIVNDINILTEHTLNLNLKDFPPRKPQLELARKWLFDNLKSKAIKKYKNTKFLEAL